MSWIECVLLLSLLGTSSCWVVDYPYILADFEICHRERPDVVIFVQGRAISTSHRSAIRQLIADRTLWPDDVRALVLFIVGVCPQSPTIQHVLKYEFEQYGDIIQNDYIEHYHNQTAKLMSAINFIDDYCKGTKLVVRMDDDVIFYPKKMMDYVLTAINGNNRNTYNVSEEYHKNLTKLGAQRTTKNYSITDQLSLGYNSVSQSTYDLLRGHLSVASPGALAISHRFEDMKNNSIVCVILSNRQIARGKHLKYRLPPEFLPGETKYPDFCAGFFFVLTADLIPKIRDLFYTETPFWIDDSYLGVIQKRLQTVNIQAMSQFLFHPKKVWRIKKHNTMKIQLMTHTRFSATVVHYAQRLFDVWLSDSDLYSKFWAL